MALGWITDGIKTSPLGVVVLADSDELENNVYEVNLVVSASVAARIDFEQRDSTNTITLKSVPIFVAAGATVNVSLPAKIVLQTGERFRLITTAGVAGVVAGSLFIQ